MTLRVVSVGFTLAAVIALILLAAWWSESHRADRHEAAIDALCDHLGLTIHHPDVRPEWQQRLIAAIWPQTYDLEPEPEPAEQVQHTQPIPLPAPVEPEAPSRGGRHRAAA